MTDPPLTNMRGNAPVISVALCTYNGERYLERQLASIARQTKPPGELVVCDDRSNDGTLSILRHFAATAAFPVSVQVNEQNLGSNRNFEQAVRRCRGEYIALCDQDDIWVPEKLERCLATLTADPSLGLVFSDGEVIDAEDQPAGSRLWQNFEFSGEAQRRLRARDYLPLVRHRFVTGATVMLRADLAAYCFPVSGEWTHDGWMAVIIACLADISFVPESLILYRRHAAQQIGIGTGATRSGLADRLHGIRRHHWLGIDWHRNALQEIVDALARVPPGQLRPTTRDFQRHLDFMRMRLTLPRSRWLRLLHLIPYLKDYPRRASGLPSVVLDLLLPKAPSEIGAAAAARFSALKRYESQA